MYRAHDARLGRDVAIEVLPTRFRSDPSFLSRFEREARAAAAVSHPNVMALYDVGSHEGAPYLVCELLDGETLRAKLGRGSLPAARAGLGEADRARAGGGARPRSGPPRSQPENLFVTRDGAVKILDFGLVKATQAEHDEKAPVAPRLTEGGAILGTLAYMAPEQVIGRPADCRADIFAFGVVCYEMLAGRSPFLGDSAPDIAFAIVTDDPPPLAAAAPAGGKVTGQR